MGGNIMAGHIEKLAPDEQIIGLLVPPSAGFAVSLMATRWLGRITMPMNYLLKPGEMAAIIVDAGLGVMFTVRPLQALAEAAAALANPGLKKPLKIVYLEDLSFVKIPWPRKLPVRNPEDTAAIMYTSGTAGVPKGVMLSNRNLEADAVNSVEHARFTERTVFLGILPMFHTLGLMANCLIPLMLGCKVVCQARFSPPAVFEAVKAHQAEVLVLVPTMFAMLAQSKSAKADSLSTIKYAISGGEPLPVPLIHAFKETFGLTLMEGFGLTETSPIVALGVPWACKAGSVGKIIPHTTVRFVDDAGADVPAGADGELWIKGPQVMQGYYNKPVETAEVLTEADGDGLRWFKTGDVAHLDEEGFLFITGRKKDMIIMAGEKVYPREIEEALKQHPAVLVAAVIGVKDETRGEMPVAFVQIKPDLPEGVTKPSEGDLRGFVRERIAPFKTPRNVYFVKDMPRSATGKVLKRDLKLPG